MAKKKMKICRAHVPAFQPAKGEAWVCEHCDKEIELCDDAKCIRHRLHADSNPYCRQCKGTGWVEKKI